jgi:hypothetical protein
VSSTVARPTPAARLGLADLRWWTRRSAGPIALRWPMVSWLSVGKPPARVARTCRRRAVALAGWNVVCVPLIGGLLWPVMAALGAVQCGAQWYLWRRHADAFEDRIRDRQRLAQAWQAAR